MKQYYAIRNSKGTLKLTEQPGSHEYTIHCTTLNGAKKCLKMIQDAEKRLGSESAD